MKKIVSLLVLLFSFSVVFADIIADPNSTLYDEIYGWEIQGLLKQLPLQRPYAPQLIKDILETVIENGNETQQERALAYYDKLFNKGFTFGVNAEAMLNPQTSYKNAVSETSLLKQLNLQGFIEGNFLLFDKIGISFEADPLLSNKKAGKELLPQFTNPSKDYESDDLSVAGFNLFTPFNSVVFAGSKDMYIQAGLSRSTWGDFLKDNVVLGSDAPHTANVSFTINQEKWNYTMSMFMLSASNTIGGNGSMPSKYMSMHSISVTPVDWFNFTIYENAVCDRFDFVYLMPLVPYMAMQQLVGYNDDNLQIGMAFRLRPVSGITWSTNIFADDIGFNDLAKLHLNTKLKLAGQTGVAVSLPESPFKLFNANYTLIAPYMYTHSQYNHDRITGKETSVCGEGFAFQNYTHAGKSLGANLPPDSDRLKVSFNLSPNEKWDIKFFSSMVRHANVNQTLPYDCQKEYLAAGSFQNGDTTYNDYLSDGSIFDYPDAGNGYFSHANHNFMFMKGTKMYDYQVGFDAAYNLNLKKAGVLQFKLGYTFEYIKNKGVDRNIFPGGQYTSQFTSGPNAFVQGESDEDRMTKINTVISDADVDGYINQWENALHDEIKHFIYFGVKYSF